MRSTTWVRTRYSRPTASRSTPATRPGATGCRASTTAGVIWCHTITNCVEACPKALEPHGGHPVAVVLQVDVAVHVGIQGLEFLVEGAVCEAGVRGRLVVRSHAPDRVEGTPGAVVLSF